jgi:hypothetical protein
MLRTGLSKMSCKIFIFNFAWLVPYPVVMPVFWILWNVNKFNSIQFNSIHKFRELFSTPYMSVLHPYLFFQHYMNVF